MSQFLTSSYYHLTHIENIPRILKHGLYARDWLEAFEIPFIDITEPYKVERRRRLGLTAFVPFHFFPWNPFDIVKLLQTLELEGSFVYITITPKQAKKLQSKVVFGFPNMNNDIYLQPLDDISISKIDKVRTNTDFTVQKNRYDALGECLIPDIVPVENFASIITASDDDKTITELYFTEPNQCPVIVHPGYFNISKSTARWFLPKRNYFDENKRKR